VIIFLKVITKECCCTTWYFQQNEFLQDILNTQNYIESFLVTEVIALPEDLEDIVEEDPLTLEEPMQHTLWKRILNFIRHGTY